MPRKAPAKAQQLQASVSLERLISIDGVALHDENGVLRGRCPRHRKGDGTMLSVDPATNTWSCASCGIQGGGPVDWTMLSRRMSLTRAIDYLAHQIDAADDINWPDDDAGLLETVATYYHQRLLRSEDALAYLESRGLRDDGLIQHLRLGIADRSLGYRLPSRSSTNGTALRKRLQACGVLRKSGHEHLAGSLVVPITDRNGVVTEMYGRKTSSKLRGGTARHLFLGDDLPKPWLLDPVAEGDVVIVASSVMDGLSWWVAGHRLVLVTPTLDIVANQLGALLEGLNATSVVFAYPRTKDAIEVIEKAAPRITERGMALYRVIFPEGLDANDVHVRGDDLLGLVRNAEWVASPPSAVKPPVVADQVDGEDEADSVSGGEVVLHLGDRRWRVRGLDRNRTPESMRVNVMVTREDALHVDTFDLYNHRHRAGFVKEASIELGLEAKVIKADLGRLLLRLEELQDEDFQCDRSSANEPVTLTPAQEAEALALLRDPDLMNRIATDLTQVGLVGEDANKLIVYLAATSRLLQDPLAIVIQSTSGSGKSTLLDAVLRMMPPESTKSFSAMTGQSLYYLGQDDLRHRILSVSEERGASRASYSLKLLQSEKTITIASTGKDPGTGRLRTETYTVEGPVALMMTTTDAIVDEELANRCVVVSVDEGREQTRAIHARQRHQETLDGLFGDLDKDKVIEVHRNAQRLLKPLHVVNPFAEDLTFADHAPRTRRDHQKYLGLIRAVALLHQHQRPVRQVERHGQTVDYMEVEPDDIKIANRLCNELLGRTLDDLLPQTRRLLVLIHEMASVKAEAMGIENGDFRFTRRMLREHVGWGQTQLRVHLGRLVEMEYILAHRGGATSATLYELAWSGEGQDGSPFVVGLVDPADLADRCRRQNAHETAGERVVEPAKEPERLASDRASADQPLENARRGSRRKSPSYRGGKG